MNKENKGITLIALVITIVVLVILVGVSVSVAINTGLIENTKTAVANYGEAQKKEEQAIQNIANLVEENRTPVVFSFLVNELDQVKTYYAEEGMTWEEWVNDTNYNTGGYFIVDDPMGRLVSIKQDYAIWGYAPTGFVEAQNVITLEDEFSEEYGYNFKVLSYD